MVNGHAVQEVGHRPDGIQAAVGASAAEGVRQGQLSHKGSRFGTAKADPSDLCHGVPVQMKALDGFRLIVNHQQHQKIRLHLIGIGQTAFAVLEFVQSHQKNCLKVFSGNVILSLPKNRFGRDCLHRCGFRLVGIRFFSFSAAHH